MFVCIHTQRHTFAWAHRHTCKLPFICKSPVPWPSLDAWNCTQQRPLYVALLIHKYPCVLFSLSVVVFNYCDKNSLMRKRVYSDHGLGIGHHYGKVRAAKAESRWAHISTVRGRKQWVRAAAQPLSSQGVVFAIIKTGLPISVSGVKIIPHKMLNSSSPR